MHMAKYLPKKNNFERNIILLLPINKILNMIKNPTIRLQQFDNHLVL